MPFEVPIKQAREDFPEYEFVCALTPSEQKAAFHVKDEEGNSLCLKIISPKYSIDRLHREIAALQSIKHRNVANLKEYTYSSKEESIRHFLVEEFIEGCDISEILKTAPIDSNQAAELFAQLCDGLAELRKKNVVHRDLKPQNIRVRNDGSPVIIDFGLARLLDSPDLTLTHQGARIGTPLYFAPEQFDGTKHDIDHRTDLFALGILIYEAVVGFHPFSGSAKTINKLRNAVCESDTYLSKKEFKRLPKKWKLLISRLLKRDRSNRPHDAAQVASILRKIGGT